MAKDRETRLKEYWDWVHATNPEQQSMTVSGESWRTAAAWMLSTIHDLEQKVMIEEHRYLREREKNHQLEQQLQLLREGV